MFEFAYFNEYPPNSNVKKLQPHKLITNMFGGQEYSEEVIPITEMLSKFEEQIINIYPTCTATPGKEKSQRDFAIKHATYLESVNFTEKEHFEKALEFIKKGLPTLHQCKDYYFLYAAASVYFSLVKKLLQNPDYISKTLDLIIPFTKDALFEIYLVDRVAYQQIVRGFYRVYGYKFRECGLPFLSVPFRMKYLPGLEYIYEMENRNSIDPYDPSWTNFRDSFHALKIRAYSPDIFIIPAYYLWLATEAGRLGHKIEHLDEYRYYAPAIQYGENVLYLNEYRTYSQDGPPKGHEYKYNENIVEFCLSREPKNPVSEEPIRPELKWYGAAYFFAESERLFEKRKEIAELAMSAPTVEDFCIEDLHLMPKNPAEDKGRQDLMTALIMAAIALPFLAFAIFILVKINANPILRFGFGALCIMILYAVVMNLMGYTGPSRGYAQANSLTQGHSSESDYYDLSKSAVGYGGSFYGRDVTKNYYDYKFMDNYTHKNKRTFFDD